jgi:S-adenosylmethionine-diacylglycerol 3-amino-3-carboxypropyl transferase
MSAISQRASFDFIRYANVWEDADLLVEALSNARDGKILSIASAGDNAFALLTLQPELLVAVDLNPVQLALVELKKAAIAALTREECVAFLGFTDSDTRWEVYQQIKNRMDDRYRNFFDEKELDIRKGIIHAGKFERYFRIFAKNMMPLIHSKKTIHDLFEIKSQEEQEQFYHEKWNTWRWRLLFKLFFSKMVMGRLGRDPEFLNEVKVPVSEFIFKKAEKHLTGVGCQQNQMLRYQLTASFGDLLPLYLRPEHYDQVRANLSALRVMEGYAEAAITPFGKMDGMNLSNIFEYMPMDVFKQSVEGLTNGLNDGGRLCYWNLMVPRKCARIHDQLSNLSELSASLAKSDKGFFYQGIVVDQKRDKA